MLDISLFLSPETLKRLEQQEREYAQKLIAKGGEPWDENKTKFKKQLVIDGNTFKPRQRFNTKPVDIDLISKNPSFKSHSISPNKTMCYRNTLWKSGAKVDLWQGNRRGHVYFTTDVIIPTLCKIYDNKPDNVWMSYTPAEILSMRRGISMASGKIVVGGLGLGYFLESVTKKKTVTEIVVVEKSQDLLDWYGNSIIEELRSTTGKTITVICDDAIEHLGKHGTDTKYLYDIWDSFPVCLTLKECKAINEVDNFWGWGVFADAF